MNIVNRPVIGITLGDPAGIGPEIVEEGLSRIRKLKKKVPVDFLLIGSGAGCRPGRLTKKSGQHALRALEQSVRYLKSGKIQGVINAPVHKANLKRLGFNYPGQTEFYADRFGIKEHQVTMMMYSPKMIVSLLSTHCSLKEAIKKVNSKSITHHTLQTVEFLKRIGISFPRLAISGLNPHAGEEGAFGNEEKKILEPAIADLNQLGKKKNFKLSGPISADAVFGQCLKKQYDAVIALYHDQGLIPFKLVAFETGVNVTLGLPFWRSSPDHGTALDLAGKGEASCESFLSSIKLMSKLFETTSK